MMSKISLSLSRREFCRGLPALNFLAILFVVCAGPIAAQETSSDSTNDDSRGAVGDGSHITRKPAHVMGVGGAPWLEREGRAAEEQSALVIEAMELRDGDVVADIGCGTGFFSRPMARQVGPTGKILAVDIQPGMLELLGKLCADEGITNVEPILGEAADPKLPAGGVDWILLVDVYHEFQQPGPMLAKMLESLSPRGRVALVEYRKEGTTGKHIKPEHTMTVREVLSEWHPAGFELVDLLEELPSQHLFIFRRRPDY